jgi:ATP-binding cassette subfamily B protein
MRYLRDDDITRQMIRPGTFRRILPYAGRYRGALTVLLLIATVDSAILAITPLLLRDIIDDGITQHREGLVVALSLTVAGLALADAVVTYTKAWYSIWIGQSLVLELRTSVFRHLQRRSSPGPRPDRWSAGSTTTSTGRSRRSACCCTARCPSCSAS